MVRADGPAVATASDERAAARWEGLRRWFAWRRGWPLTVLGLLVTLLLVCHAQVPNAVGNLGSLLETFLPWLGLAVPVLLGLALWRRAGMAVVAALLPGAVWLNLFGALLVDKSSGPGDFTVLTHNVAAANDDPQGTIRMLAGSGAEIVALEELSASAAPVYAEGLAAAFPYHVVEGTVGLWSGYPIDEVSVVDLKMGWTRAFRARVSTPKGPLAVYVAHLPSVRVKFDSGFTAGRRDVSAQALGDAIEHEPLRKVLLLGDLNGTMNDRSLAPITSQLRSAQGAAGDGFGFSWPASFPTARIDQILSKGGLVPTDSRTLPADASDHLAVAADYRY
ncbi:endonuclease/exonuclease/phosphatase family protein [Kitasatospora sp. YST-16]|uniref:endonuclease/exonuclease/phosphatase family protein n=1 Tax=unclassified Kitasatospora TaxID=2633591 RepID=UPI0004C38940|nr:MULTISPECIES: endonuclease/exonuclease/phosphatase family protein [unclassified Kitasatospora]WAL71541.1 endonuclease/exonuclease/phosphatase family protein [Kitasatospora sp. YST-16]WNW37581.1 endonuclease/exonuclease/phosphatase family protein [Streptomyces sp. Li-HN-5-13]